MGLGALGIVYAVTLKTVPAYTIARVDRPRPLAEILEGIDEIPDEHDHFEFYVFPFTETALCRESRRTDEPPNPPSRASVFLQEVVLENWAGGALRNLARYRPSMAPRLARLAASQVGQLGEGRLELPGLRLGSPHPLHRDGVRVSRASTPPR